MREKFFQFIISATIAPLLFTVGAHTAHAEEVTPPPFYDTDAHDDAIDFLLKQGIRQYSGSTQPSNETPTDDTIRQSNSAIASPDAVTAMADRNCDGKGHEGIQSDGSTALYACRPVFPKTGESGWTPTTREILYYAATTIHADGAGLHKRPSKVSFTNKYIPTIVAATHPTQTHTINLLGHDITITLKATNYEWDWGDGTPHTITAYQGMPYEKGMDLNKDPRLIRHYYTPPNGWRSRFDGPYPDATRTITLTTTWSGTATNPFTGETQTINGLVTTTETTGPFYLDHLTVSNTDTWEEKQGH